MNAADRFQIGDVVICRENPSHPMTVVGLMGQRVFVKGGTRSSYRQTELHGTGMRDAVALRLASKR